MELNLEGRVVAVTGGTKGVGRAVVEKLATSGAQVLFQGRDGEAADEIIRGVGGGGGSESGGAAAAPTFVPGDLYDYDDMSRLVGTAVERFGRLDGVVGSGGGGGAGFRLFREMAAQDLITYFQSGALPRVYLARAAAEVMAPQGYGKVVLITTDAGRVPTPGESMIGAAAASLVFLSRALGRELARDGIRVNTLAITLTKDTPGYDRFSAKRDSGADPDIHVKAFEKLESRMPFGLGTAAEAADIAAFLVAPESDGITGATLSVNRGAYFPTYA